MKCAPFHLFAKVGYIRSESNTLCYIVAALGLELWPLEDVQEAAVPSYLLQLCHHALGNFDSICGRHLYERQRVSTCHLVSYCPPHCAVFGCCWLEFLCQNGNPVCACPRYSCASKYLQHRPHFSAGKGIPTSQQQVMLPQWSIMRRCHGPPAAAVRMENTAPVAESRNGSSYQLLTK